VRYPHIHRIHKEKEKKKQKKKEKRLLLFSLNKTPTDLGKVTLIYTAEHYPAGI